MCVTMCVGMRYPTFLLTRTPTKEIEKKKKKRNVTLK